MTVTAPGPAMQRIWRMTSDLEWRTPPVYLGALLVLVLAAYSALVFTGDSAGIPGQMVYHAPHIIALVAGLAALGRATSDGRPAILAIVAASAFWFAGDLVFTVLSYPSTRFTAADVLYYLGYVAFIGATLLVSRPFIGFRDRRARADALLLLVVCSLFMVAFLVFPAFEGSDPDAGARAFTLSYPLLDLVALSVLIVSFYAGGERYAGAFVCLAMVIGTSVIGDSLFAQFLDADGNYPAHIDVWFAAVQCWFALAFVMPLPGIGPRQAVVTTGIRSAAGTWLPRVMVLLLLLFTIMDELSFSDPAGSALALGAFVAAVALMGRQSVVTRENEKLYRQIQHDAELQEAQLNALSDLGEAFIIIDSGVVVEANDAAWSIAGFTTLESRRSHSPFEVIAAADQGRVYAAMAEGVLSGRSVSGIEARIRRQDGEERWLELAGKPLTLSPTGWRLLVVARDITARKMSEHAMVESQRVESLRVMAGGIAHDFNNLIQVVRGNAHLALTRTEDDPEAQEYIQDIEAAAVKAAGLARQMLIYSGRVTEKRENVDTAAIVREMTMLLRSSVGRNVALEVTADDDSPHILADPSHLRQIVLNLVINAAEAIGEGSGAVSVHTRCIMLEAGKRATTPGDPAIPRGRYLQLTVQDTGPGMDAETRQRIFDPYFTTKFAGRGLGLAAVHGIVRGLHGSISIESSPGNGARFTVLLPAAEPAPAGVS